MVRFGFGENRLSFSVFVLRFRMDGNVVAFPGDYDRWKSWLYT